MAPVLLICVFLQAVLLCEIHCSPIKTGFAPMNKGGSNGGGSSKMSQVYQPEQQVDPGFDGASSLSDPADEGGSSVAVQPPPPHYSKGSPPGSSTDSWLIPQSIFSRREAVPSSSHAASKRPVAGPSNVSPPRPPPPPSVEFYPGELRRIEATEEGGGYESETQERSIAPPPSYKASVSQPKPKAALPRGPFRRYFYPYDWQLLTGQYPPGTYTHSSSSVERGRDDWQENHYLKYEYPASPVEEEGDYYDDDDAQQVQTFPSTQSFQPPSLGKTSGSGEQVETSQTAYNQDPLVGTYLNYYG